MIRYLLDEHVPHAIAHGLRQRGIEVATAVEADLLSVDDELIAVSQSLNVTLSSRKMTIFYEFTAKALITQELSTQNKAIAQLARSSSISNSSPSF